MTPSLDATIRCIPNFPKQGIMFRDITTLLKDRAAFANAIDVFTERYRGTPIDKVVSIESRGFIFGAPLAYKLGAGFVPVRKPGKLPAATIREEYALEYGKDAVEMHTDAIGSGEQILVLDDLLATGGTVLAACKLVERLGGTIAGLAFLIELTSLKGRERLKKYDLFSIVKFEGE
jgi:adenine phosphoribosyltransferase